MIFIQRLCRSLKFVITFYTKLEIGGTWWEMNVVEDSIFTRKNKNKADDVYRLTKGKNPINIVILLW